MNTGRADSPLTRRRRWAWIAVGVALLLAFGCGMALQSVRSPAQAALEASPPPRTVLTAQVVRTQVQASVVGRGTVTPSAPVQIPMPAAAEGATAMISATPVAIGDEVSAGTVLVAVSGRPVIVLAGTVPAYRDLRPGDEGDDVRQFQQAVANLGYDLTVDGQFGEQTKAAVRWLYQRAGFQVPATTGLGEPDDPAVTAAQATLRQAQRQVASLRSQLNQAAAPPPDDPTAPTDTATLASQLANAQQDLAVAQQTLADTQRVSGPIVPRAEVAFVASLPARLVALAGGVGSSPTDTLATLNAGDLVIDTPLDQTQASQISAGMATTWQDETSGKTGTGTVAAVGPAQATQDGAVQQAHVTITPATPIPADLSAANLKVTITVTSSGGQVLAVPIAAITASADGSTYVIHQDAAGNQTKVIVTTGVNGDGLVQITPVDADLAEGDQVVTSQ